MKSRWSYRSKESLAMTVSKDISYDVILDQLYEEIGLDRTTIDLELKVLYKFGGGDGVPIPPTKITNNANLRTWLREISSSIDHRTPLCVSIKEKASPVIKEVNVEQFNPIQSVIPEIVKPVEPITEVGETQPCPTINLNDTDYEPCINEYLPVNDNLENDQTEVREENESLDDEDDENDEDDNENFQELSQLRTSKAAERMQFDMPERPVCEDNSKTPGSQSSRVHKVSTIEENKWSRPIFSDNELPESTTENNMTSSSGVSCTMIKLGQLFENKQELKTKLHLYAMKKNFEFKVKKSGTDVWYICCIDDKCGWRMRARKLQNSTMFEIRRFVEEHTCSLELRRKDNRQAAPWVIGHFIKRKYSSQEPNYLPRAIISDMMKDYGINMTYEKAWRCREKALTYIRGTPVASYQKLPSYLYMLRQNNPGTITDIVLDDVGHFKYFFMALGACIRGFRMACRPVLCVDGSFLKTKRKGTMLCAIAQDANKQLYPLAFSVVDSENNDSWMYFMLKLRESIGLVEHLVFVSDRHQSIASALVAVFPEAHHGACIQHIGMNITAKFHTDHCHQEYFLAAKAYRISEFHHHFEKIRIKDPRIADYLEGIGIERWSRAYFPGSRYNIMTSNVAESFNNKTKNARKWPITTIAEFLRYTIQSWFYERRNEAEKSTLPIAKKMDDELQDLSKTAQTLIVQPLSHFEFYVMDGDRDGQVNLQTKSCTCGKFQLSGIPCEHALASARDRNINPYTLCSRFYSNEAWLNCYAETIYPVGNEDDWLVPDDIKSIVVHPPVEKKMPGRPQTERRPSQGEKKKIHRRCSSCGGIGHNRATCKHIMAAHSTINKDSSVRQI